MSRRSNIRTAFEQAKSLPEAAKILDVSVKQVQQWLAQDSMLTKELRDRGLLSDSDRDKSQKYVPKTGFNRRMGEFDNAPLASRRLTMREMRDCGAWVPVQVKDEEEQP